MGSKFCKSELWDKTNEEIYKLTYVQSIQMKRAGTYNFFVIDNYSNLSGQVSVKEMSDII